MSDQKISQLTLASTLDPAAIIPVSQIDPMTSILKTFGVAASTLWAGPNGTGVDSYFAFPNDTGPLAFTSGDIGKLAMNDGSGTAKIYTNSPATTAVAGEWTIDFSTIWSSGQMGMNLNFTTSNGNFSISESSWRTSPPGSGIDEITMITASLVTAIANYNSNNTPSISLTPTPSNGGATLTITEGTYQGINIMANNFPTDTFTVTHLSIPASPVAPTAFPLGKVIGIQGGDVLISAAMVQTYTQSGTFTVDQSIYNTANYGSYDFSLTSTPIDIFKIIAVPADNGTVTSFDFSLYTMNNSTLYALRHQFVGIILGVNGGNVTVLQLNGCSPIVNMVFKIAWSNQNKN
jgi:hypothetical protein